jgi:hypothetical protein
LWTFTTYDNKTVAAANFNHKEKIFPNEVAHLLAAKSPPETTALLGGGVVWRVVGGEGLDHIRVSRFNLWKQSIWYIKLTSRYKTYR